MQRVKRFVLATFVQAVAACSGASAPAPQAPIAPLPPLSPPDGGVGNLAATREQCQTLMAHVVDLAAAEHKAVTLDDREHVRRSLGPFVEQCQEETAETVRCGNAATNLDEVAACQADPPEAQTTRSSSTSNSSVAPPGITPAAPRSP